MYQERRLPDTKILKGEKIIKINSRGFKQALYNNLMGQLKTMYQERRLPDTKILKGEKNHERKKEAGKRKFKSKFDYRRKESGKKSKTET